MKNGKCSKFEKYLDRRYDELGEDYQKHLGTCPICRREVESWQRYRKLIKSAPSVSPDKLESSKAENVVSLHAIKMRQKLIFQKRLLVASYSLGAAAAAALIIITFAVIPSLHRGGRAAPVLFSSEATGDAVKTSTDESKVPVVELETSVIQTESGSLVIVAGSVIKTKMKNDRLLEVDLLSGQILAMVEKSTLEEKFIITADKLRIQPDATEFSVAKRQNVLVEVIKGRVGVSGEGVQSTSITEGTYGKYEPGQDKLQILDIASERGAVLTGLMEQAFIPKVSHEISSEKSASPPGGKKSKTVDYSTWKKMITDGRYDDAISSIESYLKTRKNDAKALMILGDAKKLNGDFYGAEISYRQASDADAGATGANALFKLSVLLEKKTLDLKKAEEGFREYLSRYPSGLLAEEARLHLARILIKTGRKEPARKHLEILINTQPGPTQKEAIKILSTME